QVDHAEHVAHGERLLGRVDPVGLDEGERPCGGGGRVRLVVVDADPQLVAAACSDLGDDVAVLPRPGAELDPHGAVPGPAAVVGDAGDGVGAAERDQPAQRDPAGRRAADEIVDGSVQLPGGQLVAGEVQEALGHLVAGDVAVEACGD